MTHTVTRQGGLFGCTNYTTRVADHTVGIRSPMSAGDDQCRSWCAYVHLRGIDSAREYGQYHAHHPTTPAEAATALLDLLPPHHRAEIAPALQAILDAPTLEPTP